MNPCDVIMKKRLGQELSREEIHAFVRGACDGSFADYQLSAMLMAGLDGIANRTEPPEPVDLDLYDLPDDIAQRVTHVPGSLEEALQALEADHEFLTAGDVFTADLIETWIDWKRANEIDPVHLRPTPHEFEMYYNV